MLGGPTVVGRAVGVGWLLTGSNEAGAILLENSLVGVGVGVSVSDASDEHEMVKIDMRMTNKNVELLDSSRFKS